LSPLEVFEKALRWISISSSRVFDKKPGAIIERMNEEDRLALQDLKSDDLNDQRFDHFYYSSFKEYYDKKEFEKYKLVFDKKIK
jgi:hypothetical protein